MRTLKHIALSGLAILALTQGWSQAQEYKFRIPRAETTVTIEADGSAAIHYKLEFECLPGAHAIDVVDIGMPTRKHEAVSAAINGKDLPLSSIRKSTYVDNAYEIHLGSGTIGPGRQGVFEFTGRSHGMVWQDTTDKRFASFRFTPTWFDPKYLQGDTQLLLRYRLPQGAYTQPDKMILWHKGTPPFQLKGVLEGETVPSVAWSKKIRMTQPHMFGVSFPKIFVKNVRRMTVWMLFKDWFSASENARITSAMIILAVFTAIFFFSTRGTGCSLFLVLAAAIAIGMYKSVVFHLWMHPALLVLAVLACLFRRSKKKHYVPASISREGGPIVSTLSAAEAAVLLDVPVNKIVTIVIFDLLRRGCIKAVSEDPLKLELLGKPEPKNRFTMNNGRTINVTKYQHRLLTIINANQGAPFETLNIEGAFKELVAAVADKAQGCDIKRTRDYCRFKVDHAWRKFRDEADFEVRTKYADKNYGWLVADEEYDDRMSVMETVEDYYYRPRWYYGHHHYHPTRPVPGIARDAAPAPAIQSPTFRDVFNSVTGRLSKIGDSMKSLPINQGRTVDLSALDTFTGKMLSDMASSSGGRGGFGGGCACACAGCACACACAGGGR